MKYYTFKERFHEPIRQRIKRSTIRPKVKVKPGERFALRFWTARPYGSPMGILGTAVCVSVEPIHIDAEGELVAVSIGGRALSTGEIHALATQEGFASLDEMMQWFAVDRGLPVVGVLTTWDPATYEDADRARGAGEGAADG